MRDGEDTGVTVAPTDATVAVAVTAVLPGEAVGGGGVGVTGGRAVGVPGAASDRAGKASPARPSSPEEKVKCRKKSRRSIRIRSWESGCRQSAPKESNWHASCTRTTGRKGNCARRNFVLIVRMDCALVDQREYCPAELHVTRWSVASLVRRKRTASARQWSWQARSQLKCLTNSTDVLPLGSRLVRRGASYANRSLHSDGPKPPPRPRTGTGGFFDPLEKGTQE